MTFLELYGAQLDIQLASSDTTQLFTTARRKKAVNDAMAVFVAETACTRVNGSIAMTDEVGAYDLDVSFSGALLRVAAPPSIHITLGSTVRSLQGPDMLPRREVDEMNVVTPGWRWLSPGTPSAWYLEKTGGVYYIGVTPAPSFAVSETWALEVPYIAQPTALSADADVPFTISTNVILTLAPFHQALVHYAASQLEPLRKNYDGAKVQYNQFAAYVDRYLRQQQRDSSPTIQIAHDYYRNRTRPDWGWT